MSGSPTSDGWHSFPAPAKLNLFLHVVGRRSDGYHLLQTVFQFIDLSDTVSIRLRKDGALTRANPLPGVAPENDLTVRAARLLQRVTRTSLGAEIALDKRLPMGGGLGGGSSDAATVLLALNALWQTRFSRDRLQTLALDLGADVPVFIFGQNAFAEGVGEKLKAIALPPRWFVVLAPPAHVATAAVFADPELTRNSIPITISDFSAGAGHNDLAPVVCKKYPAVAVYLAWLGQFGSARMTGSGACVFAAFESEASAQRVLAQLPSGWRGWLARGLDRHPLYGLAE